MLETKELICVNCPKGCRITVTLNDGKVEDIKGYSCDKGKRYASQETIRPMRVLTSTVKLDEGKMRVLPVMTNKEIPLDMCKEAMEEIRKIRVTAPVKINDVIIPHFLGTDADLIASRSASRQ